VDGGEAAAAADGVDAWSLMDDICSLSVVFKWNV
jgi:hypothetical protein